MPFLPAHRPTQRYAGPAWTKSSHLTGNRPMQRKARRDVKPIRSKAHLLHKPATKLRFVPSKNKTKQNKLRFVLLQAPAPPFGGVRLAHCFMHRMDAWRAHAKLLFIRGARANATCSSVAGRLCFRRGKSEP